MEPGYTKADSLNLPEVDILMIGDFFSTYSNYCDAEFRNVKAVSARQSYGDDAIRYVQLRRDSDMCTIKCRVYPEHKIRTKSYAATMIVDEMERKIVSIQCHDCTAATGGCIHSVAFLLWVHRRSEEPSRPEIQCYWKKIKLARVGTNIKFITTKELSGCKRQQSIPPATNNNVLTQFLQEATSRGVKNCGLVNYYIDTLDEHEKLSLHYLIIKHCGNGDSDSFLGKISPYFTIENIKMIEENTRAKHKSRLWHELRYGRITASKAYEVSKCCTADETLLAMIMGAKTLDTKAMRRGRKLESKVKVLIEKTLGKKLKECGLFISSQHPYIAGSPDGIYDDKVCVEIKYPTTEKTYKNYIRNNKVTDKYLAQMQIQMFVTNLKNCYFCVADYNFEFTEHVEMVLVSYDEDLVQHYISSINKFWVKNVYPILCDTTK